MLLSSAPTQIVEAWAAGGDKNVVPVPDPGSPGAASWTLGFPPDTAIDPTDGGEPPNRLDMNGGLFEMSAIDLWMSAGAGFPYSSAFSTAVGGYPKGARVLRATGNGYWLSTADTNTTDPDTGGAGWIPDIAVASIYASAQQTLATGSAKVVFDTVEFDSLSTWDATNHRFKANWAGLYRMSGAIYLPSAPGGNISARIYKNGSFTKLGSGFPQTSDGTLSYSFDAVVSCAATDYLEVFLFTDNGASVLAGQVGSNQAYVYAQLEYLGNG